jgi:DNA-directed RNA polymerase specialized sigma24 family protein
VTEKFATAHARISGYGSTHLHDLVARIATGDHLAFRSLYALLAMRVWRDASRLMRHPTDTQAVTRSTFVEVWRLARHHLDDGGPDTADWIAEITAQQVEERLRSIGTLSQALDDYDRHTYRTFAAMIGARGTRSEPEPIEPGVVQDDEPATVGEEAQS